MKYDHLEVLNGFVGKSSVRLTVEEALQNKTWRKVGQEIEGLDRKCYDALAEGMEHMLKRTWVGAWEPHYDAKTFVDLHPYGTGSLLSEVGSGGQNGIPRMCANRLLLIQSSFRENAVWAFFNLQRMITNHLFYMEAAKRRHQMKTTSNPESKDSDTRRYGTVVPSDHANFPGIAAWVYGCGVAVGSFLSAREYWKAASRKVLNGGRIRASNYSL